MLARHRLMGGLRERRWRRDEMRRLERRWSLKKRVEESINILRMRWRVRLRVDLRVGEIYFLTCKRKEAYKAIPIRLHIHHVDAA